ADLDRLAFAPGRIPVFANSTAAEYPVDRDAACALLAGQLANPVEFVKQIEAMYAAGARTFVEVGPGAVLAGLVQAILADRDHDVVSLDASAGKRHGMVDLAHFVARLAVLGRSVKIAAWDGDPAGRVAPPPEKPGRTVPLCGANYVKPKPPIPPAARSAVAAPSTEPAPSELRRQREPVVKMSLSVSEPPVAEPTSVNGSAVAQSLQALIDLQRQTAELHRRFLEQQSRTQEMLEALVTRHLAPSSDKVVSKVHQPTEPSVSTGGPEFRPTKDTEVGDEPAPAMDVFDLLGGDATPETPFLDAPAPELPAVPRVTAPDFAPAVVQSTAFDEVRAALLEVVAEKTGYPAEMLEPAMELDADLGIDSIKRVEILSAIQERLPDAPEVKAELLGELRTLGQIIEFLSAADAAEPTMPAPSAPPRMEAAPVAPISASSDRVRAVLLEVVAEKTGYPAEMLEPAMELDADLGIDSIKRVEILSAIQERLPDAPEVKAELLGELRTLGQIIDYLSVGDTAMAPRGDLTPPAPIASGLPAPPAGPRVGRNDVQSVLLEVVAEKTGYPAEMLEPAMELDADLGIDSIKRVEILSAIQERLPDAPEVKAELLGELRTLGQIIDYLAAVDTPTPTPAPPPPVVAEAVVHPTQASSKTAPGGRDAATPSPVAADATAVVSRFVLRPEELEPAAKRPKIKLADADLWVTADGSAFAEALVGKLQAGGVAARLVDPAAPPSVPDRLAGLVLVAPAVGADDAFLLRAFQLVRAAGAALKSTAAAGGAVLATVARLDGAFGSAGWDAPVDPTSGGLAGLAKTVGHEWPAVVAKAFDVGAARGGELAGAVADELLRAGPVEIGFTRAGRMTLVSVAAAPLERARPPALHAGDVVLATGGARGVTAETIVALARACRPTFVLFGRTPLPPAEPKWLAACATEAEMKKALVGRPGPTGAPASPREINDALRQIAAGREIRQTLDRLRAADSVVEYHALDVRDAAGVRAKLADVRRRLGPIRGLIHGAGVLADCRIEDKTDDKFRRVYDTKVGGLRTLLDALADDDLRGLVFFSSSTGRFGRTGQVDYAMANEVLNKLAQEQARRRPTCRTVSLNWGPWDGGMVDDGLRKLFAAEGVGVIPLEAGADLMVDELRQPPGGPTAAVEVVVLAGAPSLDKLAPASRHAPGVETNGAPSESGVGRPPMDVVLERELSLDRCPVLRSHVLGGRAVVPVALMVEWMGHAALHGAPGFVFLGVDGLRVYRGLSVDDGAVVSLTLRAGKPTTKDGATTVAVELRSRTRDREIVHTAASVVLGKSLPAAPAATVAAPKKADPRSVADAYQNVLFHGPDLQGIAELLGCDAGGVAGRVRPAPLPAEWQRQPWRQGWIAEPLALDGAFQLMILWTAAERGAPSLPTSFASYRQYRRVFPTEGVTIRAAVRADGRSASTKGYGTVKAEIEFLDDAGRLVARMEGYEAAVDGALTAAFRQNTVKPIAPSAAMV
ncbi:MAG: SDR family NAD(P)-dependent oxidoreductase, partial [Planctomycetia bacterium]